MSITIYLLQFIAFLDLLAVGLIVPLVASHARRLGASHVSVGLLGTIYAAFQFGSGPLIGSLSDLKGRKTILILSLIVCSFAYTLTGSVSSVIGILCLRAVLGLFKQSQMLTKAMVADYETCEARQSEIYGKMAAISGVGITLGPVIGGHIQEDYPEHGFQYISTAVGVCFLINAGFAHFLPKTILEELEEKKMQVQRETRQGSRGKRKPPPGAAELFTSSLKQSAIELYKVDWSKFWDVFLLKALIGFAMGVYYSNYALYLKTMYELSPKYTGYIISFQGVVGTLSSFFIGSINRFYHGDENFSLRNLHVFLMISLSLFGLVMSYNVFVYALWLVPLAMGNAIGRLVTLEMILKRSDGEHCGTLIGASNSVRSLAGVGAPMVAGLISQYIGVSYVIYASFFATLMGLVISCYCHYENKKIKVD